MDSHFAFTLLDLSHLHPINLVGDTNEMLANPALLQNQVMIDIFGRRKHVLRPWLGAKGEELLHPLMTVT